MVEKQNKKLRVFAASDIHGDTKLASRLAEKAKKENADLVILCGDLTMAELSTEGIVGPFIKAGKKVLLIPGNHETVATADFLADFYGAKNIHGYSIRMGDVGIFGCGGANIGPFFISESEITDLVKRGHDKIRDTRKKILVTHVHPSSSLIEKMSNIPGSKAVSNAIKKFKPEFAICGHVHEAEGVEETIGNTRVMNVGREGKIFEL